jgi:predicted glycogen debranching enzyme
VDREWLVTIGLGGYASGTISCATTRRYHGLLVSAEPPPLGRTLSLVDLWETVRIDGQELRLGGTERPDRLELHGARFLREFRLEWGLPVWTYEFGGATLERRLAMVWGSNTTLIEYRLRSDRNTELELRPIVRFRPHDTPVDAPLEEGYRCAREENGVLVSTESGFPPLRLAVERPEVLFTDDAQILPNFVYRIEASRGYAAVGDTWSPGYWRTSSSRELTLRVLATTGPWESLPRGSEIAEVIEQEMDRRHRLTLAAHPVARRGPAAELVLAADQFIIRPLRHPSWKGEREQSVIAGYHWFTDWGRDTMISLEGLTLVTGREREAGAILRTFATHVRDGLIPNLFPEGGVEGLYHTADATLWFFHALHRYVDHTGDTETLAKLLPTMRDIVAAHVSGTSFGIGVDPADGLLKQGALGYQLTWMDAKVGDWVVTPRRGKAVEINALWYNALKLLEAWEYDVGDPSRAEALAVRAAHARESFNRRFWIHDEEYLFDVVDGEAGDDRAFRPNQIFAVSLPHAVLDEARWGSVVTQVKKRLLTPYGLRTLAAEDPDYRTTYFGNLWARDAAYHQGTVWAWLIGPFIDAWLKVHPGDERRARGFLSGLLEHLDEFGIGNVAEIFDAEPPHRPRGCIAQAWSVAELLRALVLCSR